MSEAQIFALGVTLAWLAGIRAYLTVFGLGLAGQFGWVELPGVLQLCQSPWVLGVSGILALLEFATDKIPGVDSGWDLFQTLLRVPAGAFLASAAMAGPEGGMSAGWAVTGGGAALFSHGIKAGMRTLINASPEPVSNILASLGEDSLALLTLALVFAHPWLALGLLLGVSLTAALLLLWLVQRWRRWRRRREQVVRPDSGSVAKV